MVFDSLEVIVAMIPAVNPLLNSMSFKNRLQSTVSFHAQSSTFPKGSDEQAPAYTGHLLVEKYKIQTRKQTKKQIQFCTSQSTLKMPSLPVSH